MLFRREFLDGIRDGRITLAFRRWRRPSVSAGGTLLTGIGQLEILGVDRVAPDSITGPEAVRAGFASLDALKEELDRRTEGEVYRVRLGRLRADPRITLRETPPQDVEEVLARLRRLDARAACGPWTQRTLEVIEARPAVRAGDLCLELGMAKEPFKVNVRKLKNLGLTESLGTGYRLSPRGRSLVAALRTEGS